MSSRPSTPYEWFERAGGREALAERLTWRGLGRRSLAGTAGGVFAGACMMGVIALWDLASLDDPWITARLFAATFTGVGALVGGAGTVVAGLAIHAFIAALWGVAFAFCVSRGASVANAIGLGLGHALLVWSTMTWTVLPWADPTFYARYSFIGWRWLAYHVVYGVASAAIVLVLRLFPRGRRDSGADQVPDEDRTPPRR